MQFDNAQNTGGKESDNSLNDQEAVGEEEYELDQEQVIQTILAIGNEIWHNFGQEEEIDDYQVFFQHQFYIRCF